MLIKLILLAVVLVAAVYLVRGTQDTKNVALRRLLLLVFVALAVATIAVSYTHLTLPTNREV